MKTQDRKSRIIARGEHSNHSHIITGDAIVRNERGEIIIEIGQEGVVLKHLLETDWLDGKEVWTKEHTDIDLSSLPNQVRHGDVMLERISDRTYKFIQQQVFDPLTKRIEAARD
jgi:hypothetical protein